METHGVLAKIAMKIKLPNNNYKIKFNLMSRIKVNEYFLTDPYFVADYEELESKVGEIEEETTLLKLITDEAVVNANQLFNNAQVITSQIQSGLSSDKMADILAYNLRTQDTEKYKYLAELNVNSRLKLILEDINRLKMIADLEQRINEDVKKAIDENQKEYYLREKCAQFKMNWVIRLKKKMKLIN
nr:LON peptidase substrate-binding domain-containing protein [Acholeplasma laidlawii]